MRRRELLRLIHQEVDGVNTPVESAHLQEALKADPEAQMLLEDLRRLSSTLGAVRPAPVPAGFLQGVMRQVPHGTGAPARSTTRTVADRLGRLFARHAYGFVSGLAAGVALLVLYISVTSVHPVGPGDATGSIVVWPPSVSQLQPAGAIKLSRADLQGRIAALYGDSLEVVRVEMRSGGALARFTFDPDALALQGVVRGEGFRGTVVLRDGLIETEAAGGDCSFIFLRKKEEPDGLHVEVSSGGARLYDGGLALQPEGR